MVCRCESAPAQRPDLQARSPCRAAISASMPARLGVGVPGSATSSGAMSLRRHSVGQHHPTLPALSIGRRCRSPGHHRAAHGQTSIPASAPDRSGSRRLQRVVGSSYAAPRWPTQRCRPGGNTQSLTSVVIGTQRARHPRPRSWPRAMVLGPSGGRAAAPRLSAGSEADLSGREADRGALPRPYYAHSAAAPTAPLAAAPAEPQRAQAAEQFDTHWRGRQRTHGRPRRASDRTSEDHEHTRI